MKSFFISIYGHCVLVFTLVVIRTLYLRHSGLGFSIEFSDTFQQWVFI